MRALTKFAKILIVLMLIQGYGYILFMGMWTILAALKLAPELLNHSPECDAHPEWDWCGGSGFGWKDWGIAITFISCAAMPFLMMYLDRVGEGDFMQEFFEKHSTRILVLLALYLIVLAVGSAIASVRFLIYVGDGL